MIQTCQTSTLELYNNSAPHEIIYLLQDVTCAKMMSFRQDLSICSPTNAYIHKVVFVNFSYTCKFIWSIIMFIGTLAVFIIIYKAPSIMLLLQFTIAQKTLK